MRVDPLATKRVGDAVRAAVAEAGWRTLAPDATWDFLVASSDAAPSVLDVEPDVDTEEAAVDAA